MTWICPRVHKAWRNIDTVFQFSHMGKCRLLEFSQELSSVTFRRRFKSLKCIQTIFDMLVILGTGRPT